MDEITMAHYEITVVEVTYSEVPQDTEWLKVADSGNERGDGAIYEYVQPPGTKTKTLRRTVYEQRVPALYLDHIIRAVNGMEPKDGA